VALGTLRQQGFAVTAVLVLCDPDTLNQAFGRLHAQGVRDVRHVSNDETLSDLCNRQMVRGGVFDYAIE